MLNYYNPNLNYMGQQNPYSMQNWGQTNQFTQPQNTAQQLIRVNGIEGAKAYQMPPNSTAALFDSNNDLMYIKITDGAGFPTIRTFAFTEYTATQNTEQVNEYVTKSEFEKFKSEVLNYGKQFIQSGATKPHPGTGTVKSAGADNTK